MAGKTSKTYAWKDPGGLTLAVMIVLSISILASALSSAIDIGFGDAALYGAGDAEFSAPQFLRWIVDLLQLVLLLACLVVPFWLVRVSKNARSFKPNLRHSPLGAVGWYLVPLACLFKPYEAMSEIWAVSSSSGGKGRDSLLNAWWGLWLLSSFVRSGLLMTHRAGGWNGLRIAGDLGALLVSMLFLMVVRRVSAMQIAKRAGWTPEMAEVRPASVLERTAD
jgi:hypothetical protein